ncbi:MAG TPA: SgcJ/EcaC family oxidoreductase [Bryobacteraceae bacterium]|nr:SgcJ/EcaC family oxidoreductase [Bryobacteraceae bacterium]
MLRWCLFLFCTPLLFAQTDEIRAMMRHSQDNWNRGDLAGFAADYEDSPDTTFVGKTVTRGGTAAILDRYRAHYPNREAMGTLTFSELSIRVLTPEFVLCTGKYSLSRTAAGGGDASGRFTLVIHKSSKGWKIIHDHTS